MSTHTQPTTPMFPHTVVCPRARLCPMKTSHDDALRVRPANRSTPAALTPAHQTHSPALDSGSRSQWTLFLRTCGVKGEVLRLWCGWGRTAGRWHRSTRAGGRGSTARDTGANSRHSGSQQTRRDSPRLESYFSHSGQVVSVSPRSVSDPHAISLTLSHRPWPPGGLSGVVPRHDSFDTTCSGSQNKVSTASRARSLDSQICCVREPSRCDSQRF